MQAEAAAVECWGEFNTLREVNSAIEYGGYTQCRNPHDLYLKIDLQKRNKSTGAWGKVFSATNVRFGWIVNVFRDVSCSGSTSQKYRMKAFPTMDGVAMVNYGDVSDVKELSCNIAFLSGDRQAQ